MTYNPKGIGENSEAAVLAALLRAGKIVLKPFGDNQRYDLVTDEGDGKFCRIQCKTGRLKHDGAVLLFDTCSSYVHRGRGKRDYKGDADVFAVYSPELDKVYLVPVAETGSRGCHLRVIPSKSGQFKKTRVAAKYELFSRVPKWNGTPLLTE